MPPIVTLPFNESHPAPKYDKSEGMVASGLTVISDVKPYEATHLWREAIFCLVKSQNPFLFASVGFWLTQNLKNVAFYF